MVERAMKFPRDKPRPKCGECFFYQADTEHMGYCIEQSDSNSYSGSKRNKHAVCCDYFLYRENK